MPGFIEELMNNIFCSIPLVDVESVHIIGPPVSTTFWRKLLGHLRDVRYIKLKQGDMPDLASVLALTTHEGPENRDECSGKLAPVLQELELDKIGFLPEGGQGSSISQHCLFDALSTRGVPKGRLTMTQCAICDGTMLRSGPINTVRSWDGLISVLVDGVRLLHSYEESESEEEDDWEDDSDDE